MSIINTDLAQDDLDALWLASRITLDQLGDVPHGLNERVKLRLARLENEGHCTRNDYNRHILKKSTPMDPVRLANADTARDLLTRIPDVIPGSTPRTEPSNLRWMMNRVIDEIDTFPVDKTGRWIGFVQGVLAFSENLDVDEERDRTRDRYHAAYKATGQVVPKTMEKPE